MVATTVLVALLACQICVIDGYKLANTRMQISMASSNPFGSFMGGMNKPSSSSGGNNRLRWPALSCTTLRVLKRFKRSKSRPWKNCSAQDSPNLRGLILSYRTTFTACFTLSWCDKLIEYFRLLHCLMFMTLFNRQYVWPWLTLLHFTSLHFVSFLIRWKDCVDHRCDRVDWNRTHKVIEKQEHHCETADYWF